MSASVGKRIVRVLAGFVVVGGVLAVLVVLFGLTKLSDNEIGIRVNNIPFFHGVEKEALTKPTYYFSIPNLLVIYKVPTDVKTIEMVERGDVTFEKRKSESLIEEPSNATPPGSNSRMDTVKKEMEELNNINVLVHDVRTGKESVSVKTSDGNDVWVDIIVGYRVRPELAFKVVENIGLKSGNFSSDIETLVNSVSRGIIRSYLSALHTKQILDPSALNKAVDVAHASINDALDDFGLEIISLKAQRVTMHPDFEYVLQHKLIARENAAELLEAAKKAKQFAVTRRFQAQGEADALIAIAEGHKSRLSQQAKAELAAMQQEANALGVTYRELGEGIAAITAELDKPGGDTHVGLAVAQAIQGKKIIIVPSEGALNLLNVNEILQSYGAANLLMNKDAKTDNDPAPKPKAKMETTTPPPATGASIELDNKSGMVEEETGPPLEEIAAPPAAPQAEVTEEWEPEVK